MHLVLGISSVLGIMGVIASPGIFFLAEHFFRSPRDIVQIFIV